MDDIQKELEQDNQALIEYLSIIQERMEHYQKQLDRLLNLYLDGDFSKEVLTERKSRLKDMRFNLGKEQNKQMDHIRHVTMIDDQLSYIEAFCAKIRTDLDQADFNAKHQIIELLDVRGKIAFENGQKVVYLKCLIDPKEQQQRLLILTSPLSNIGATATIYFASPLTAPSP